MSSNTSQRVTLARLLRPHGRRGEIAAEILTDFPERLTRLKNVFLWDGSGDPREMAIRSCRLSPSRGGQAVFHFAGVDSINEAERYRDLQVQVPMEERATLAEGNYYISDLIGCEVWEQAAKSPLGVVRDVTRDSGTPILQVEGPAKNEVLIPLATEICTRIEPKARRIEVVLPEGLLDLNR